MKFSENGYLIIKNGISKKLLFNIQKEIFNFLKITGKTEIEKYKKFSNKVIKSKINTYEFTKPIFEYLNYKGYLKKIFLEKKLLKYTSDLIGKDLAYSTDPGFTLNIPGKNNPKKNYHFKDWHQEMWSGASPSVSLQVWTPLIKNSSKSNKGHLEIMNSHK